MAGNIILTQVLLADSTSTVQVKYSLVADGTEEWDKDLLFNASLYFGSSTENKLMNIQYEFNGFTAQLFWDATVDVPLVSLGQNHAEYCDYGIFHVGGLTNNAGAGRTGNILISSLGVEETPGNGHIIITVKNKQESER
jgi:hypothetical protein